MSIHQSVTNGQRDRVTFKFIINVNVMQTKHAILYKSTPQKSIKISILN